MKNKLKWEEVGLESREVVVHIQIKAGNRRVITVENRKKFPSIYKRFNSIKQAQRYVRTLKAAPLKVIQYRCQVARTALLLVNYHNQYGWYGQATCNNLEATGRFNEPTAAKLFCEDVLTVLQRHKAIGPLYYL